MNAYGQLGGSNIVMVHTGEYQNSSDLTLSVPLEGYLNAGDTLWYNFPVLSGEYYKVSWQESSTAISGYRENKYDHYFTKTTVIPMDGSPKTLVALDDELAYLQVIGQDESISSEFHLLVEPLDRLNANAIPFDQVQTLRINPGESKIYYFDSIQDSSYEINAYTSSMGSWDDDEISIKLSAYSQNQLTPYFYEQFAGLSFVEVGPKILNLTAISTEKTYVVITGAYWVSPTDVFLTISKSNN